MKDNPLPQEGNEEELQEQQEEPKTFDADYVKRLRAEAAKFRTERNAALEKIKAAEQEKLTKEEQAAQKLKDLEIREQELIKRIRGLALRNAVMAAGNGKLASVDVVLKLLDAESIEYDDENNPLGVEAAVAKLLKDYPFLGSPTSSGNTTNPERHRRLTLDDVKNMSIEEINSRWDEVQAVMKG